MTRVAVIGAGTMGHGIAYVALAGGYDVSLFDVSQDSLERAVTDIRLALDSAVKRGKMDARASNGAIARINVTTDIADAVAAAEVVVEAVPERLELKQEIFRSIAASAPAKALLATNTSSLSVTAIGSALGSPERLVGMHFFNPVAAMKLVEIVRGERTGDETVARARDFTTSVGKTAIIVGDTPGFATSRLGIVLGLEAMRMVEQGVASAADIDRAMELGYNHPIGPLRLTDIVGLDVRLAVADHLYASFGKDTYTAPAILREMVADGRLGRKSGEGFYTWPREE